MGVTSEEIKLILGGDSAGARKAVSDLQESITGLAKQHEESFRAIGIAAGAVAGAIVGISAAVVELGQRGADIADVQAQFAVLNTSIGNNAASLQNTLRQAVAGTISDFELLKTTNLGLSQGLQLNEQQFGLTGKAARVLADRVGGDTATAYGNLVMAMSTGQDKLLKQIGLNIDAAAAVKGHAASLGVEVDALTESQVISAKRTAILTEMQRVLAESGEAEVDFADRIAQGRVAFQNMMDDLAVGIAQSPVFAAAMDGIANAVTGTFGGQSQGLIKTIVSLLESAAITLIGLGEAGVSVAKFLTQAFYGTRAIFFGIAEAITNVVATVFDAIATTAEYAEKIPGIGDQFRPLAQSFREATSVADAMAASFKATKNEALDSADTSGKAFDRVNTSLASLRTGMEAAQRTEDAHTESVKANAAEHVIRTEAVSGSTEAVKKHTAALAALIDKLSGNAAIGQALLYLEALQKTGGVTHLTAKEQETLNTSLSDALEKYRALGEQAPAALVKVWAATLKQPTIVPLAQALTALPGQINLLPLPVQTIAPLFSNLAPALKGSIDSSKGTITGALTSALSDLPTILQQAFTGGGGVGGAINALGARIGGDLFGKDGAFAGVTQAATGGLTSMFGKTIGGALGAAIPGIGALIGPGLQLLWGGITKLFGGGEESAKVNAPREQFVQAAGGLAQLNEQVYKATGSLSQVQALLGAKTEKDYNAAIQAINKSLGDFKTKLDAAHQSQAAIAERMAHTTSISPALKTALEQAYSAKTIDDYTAALKGVNSVLDAQAAKQSHVNDTLKEFGLDWTEAGEEFKQAKISETAAHYVESFHTMKEAGVDVNHEMAAMGPKLNEFVKDAQKAGVQVPASMKEVLQVAIDSGVLYDENGKKVEKLTDLGLTFGETSADSMKTAADAMTRLADVLEKVLTPQLSGAKGAAEGIANALNSVPEERTYRYNVERTGDDAGYASTGGWVTSRGISYFGGGGFVPHGTDTVPAMLTPGEAILNRDAAGALGPAGVSALNDGGALMKSMRAIAAGDLQVFGAALVRLDPGTVLA